MMKICVLSGLIVVFTTSSIDAAGPRMPWCR